MSFFWFASSLVPEENCWDKWNRFLLLDAFPFKTNSVGAMKETYKYKEYFKLGFEI